MYSATADEIKSNSWTKVFDFPDYIKGQNIKTCDLRGGKFWIYTDSKTKYWTYDFVDFTEYKFYNKTFDWNSISSRSPNEADPAVCRCSWYPSAVAAIDINNVSIAGNTAVCKDDTETYSVTYDGSATDVTYLWESTDTMAVISDPTAATTDVQFKTEGVRKLKCTLSSVSAVDSDQIDEIDVTIADCACVPPYVYQPREQWSSMVTGTPRS